VKVSAITLHKKMQPDQNIADDRSLARYFPDEEPLNNSHGDATGEGENVEGTPEGGQGGSGGKGAPRGGRLLRIDSGPTMGSIVLRPIDASKMQIGMKFEIETAYALRGGDSFAAWDMEDFKIVDLYDEKNSSGVEINFSENKAQFVLEQLDFSILFSGFDVNRDLSIDVKRVR
jgi:hypothetical protein